MIVVFKGKVKWITLVILLFLIIAVLYDSYPSRKNIEIPSKVSEGINRLIFYDSNSFFKGVAWAEKNTPKSNLQIKIGVIPHHLFPGFIFSDFFLRLKTNPPKTIILVGPNHYERGNFKTLTSKNKWQTPFGEVNPDDQIINSLLKENKVKVNDNVLTEDHAVSGSMSYVKYYLSNTKVVPLLLSGTLNIQDTEALADGLIKLMNDNTVVVAPVDFSHYLSAKEAEEKDKITLQIMKDFDYQKLYSLNNDYLDSPASIGLILMLSQKLGYKNLSILQHTNSGILQNNNSIQTTSYLSFYTY